MDRIIEYLRLLRCNYDGVQNYYSGSISSVFCFDSYELRYCDFEIFLRLCSVFNEFKSGDYSLVSKLSSYLVSVLPPSEIIFIVNHYPMSDSLVLQNIIIKGLDLSLFDLDVLWCYDPNHLVEGRHYYTPQSFYNLCGACYHPLSFFNVH